MCRKNKTSHFRIMSDISHFSILLVTSKFAKHSMLNTLIIFFQLDYWSRKNKGKRKMSEFWSQLSYKQSHNLDFHNYTYALMRLTYMQSILSVHCKILINQYVTSIKCKEELLLILISLEWRNHLLYLGYFTYRDSKYDWENITSIDYSHTAYICTFIHLPLL